MTPIVIQASRRKWVAFLIGAVCFVAGGVLIVAHGVGALVGWMNILFFGGCALIFAFNVFDRRPRIVIDDDGILDRTLKVGLIEWADIRSVHLKHSQGQPFLCLDLRDSTKYTERLSPILRRMVALNHLLGFTDLSLNLIGADVAAEQVEELVRKELAVRRLES